MARTRRDHDMICIHHNDADGRCSAAIVNKFAKVDKFIEMDYKDELCLLDIDPEETVWIVDFSFKPNAMKLITDRTSNIIWIDHHKTARDYGYKFQGSFDITQAACELTWDYCSRNARPWVVSLVGSYDTWRHDIPGTYAFNEGIRLHNHGPLEPIWNELFMGNMVEDIIKEGEVCIKYRDQQCDSLIKHFGYEAEFEGYKMFACNMRAGSPGFGDLINKYDACISFIFDGAWWHASLYSSKIDVSTIAKKYNGGGHRGAAGFSCAILPWRKL